MNCTCFLTLAFVLCQSAAQKPAHDLTGTWTCHSSIADSTWTFGPKNRFIGEGRTSRGGQVSVYHNDGTYTLKEGVLHVHSQSEWTLKGKSKSTVKTKDWESNIVWMSDDAFKSDQGFIFIKAASRPSHTKHS